MPVVIDAGLETYNAFGVVATPSTAVINAEGKIVHEAASYLRSTGDDIRESVEILLGVREAAEGRRRRGQAGLQARLEGAAALQLRPHDAPARQPGQGDRTSSSWPPRPTPTYAAPRIFLGQLLLAKKDPKSLAAGRWSCSTRRSTLAPEDVTAHTGSGEALLELGKTDEALAAFEKAVALDPTYTPAMSNLALVLAKQGKSADAEAKFKAALELNPLDAGTYYRRAQGSEAGGDLKGASADFRRALEILMNLPSTGDEV